MLFNRRQRSTQHQTSHIFMDKRTAEQFIASKRAFMALFISLGCEKAEVGKYHIFLGRSEFTRGFSRTDDYWVPIAIPKSIGLRYDELDSELLVSDGTCYLIHETQGLSGPGPAFQIKSIGAPITWVWGTKQKP